MDQNLENEKEFTDQGLTIKGVAKEVQLCFGT